ncbi:leucine-rich repeat domain-containing protein [Gottfriedia sp. NPDC057948]|uniref:leucine-rich repeat domain-containing protein n=1 Tax=Gottfriedia sp. NPDC057948 TaxID=3346287 RepID=UPI0036DA9B8F
MSLIKDPELIFCINERPQFTDDLNGVDTTLTELVIRGKTKNLDRLKLFTKLEKLWIYTVNQKEFEVILNVVDPKLLYLYEMRVEDLSLISTLKKLEILSLTWNTKAQSLWDVTKNTLLKSLFIEDFSKLNNISSLNNNLKLEYLNLSGGMWNSLNLDNLKDLSNLSNLKYLGLSNIKTKDESLEPIGYLKNLQELDISNQFPTEEYARLSVLLPNTKCDYFKPYIVLSDPIDDKDLMVIGKRKPFFNSKVDAKKLQKYKDQFEDLQIKYRK